MKLISFLLWLLFTVGCYPTIKDIRSYHPILISYSPKPPNIVANCIVYKAQGENWDPISVSEVDGVYHITMGHMLADIKVMSDGNKGSILELRSFNAPIRIYIQ